MYNLKIKEGGILKKIDCVLMTFFIILDDVNLEDVELYNLPDYLSENAIKEFEFDYSTSTENFSVALARFILSCNVKSKVIDNLNSMYNSNIDCGYTPVTIVLDDGNTMILDITEFKDIVFGGRNEI